MKRLLVALLCGMLAVGVVGCDDDDEIEIERRDGLDTEEIEIEIDD